MCRQSVTKRTLGVQKKPDTLPWYLAFKSVGWSEAIDSLTGGCGGSVRHMWTCQLAGLLWRSVRFSRAGRRYGSIMEYAGL